MCTDRHTLSGGRADSRTLLRIMVLCSLLIAACDALLDPEPIINTVARPASIRPYISETYSELQKVTGIISIRFVPEEEGARVASVSSYVDSVQQEGDASAPYIFTIDTRKWADGPHSISFRVYESSNTRGLGGINDNILAVYHLTLTFDNTLPIAPANFSVERSGSHARLSWVPSTQSAFTAYHIRRNGELITTLTRRSDSVYVDSSGIVPDVGSVYYGIDVTISNGRAAASPNDTLTAGTSLGLTQVSTIYDKLSGVVLFQTSQVQAISTTTATEKARYNVQGGRLMSRSLDGNRLFLWNSTTQFILNSSTLATIHTGFVGFYAGGASAFVVGNGDRLFVVSGRGLYVNVNGTVTTIDNLFDGPDPAVSIATDGSFFFAAGSGGIRRYTHSSSFQGEFVTPGVRSDIRDSIESFQMDWSTMRAFTKRNGTVVEIWDMNQLVPLRSVTAPSGSNIGTVLAIKAMSNRLYVAYGGTFNGKPGTMLAEYDTDTGQLLRTWMLQFPISSLAATFSGRYLFACTAADQWIIDVGGAP